MMRLPISQCIKLFLDDTNHKPYTKVFAKRLFEEVNREMENDKNISIVGDMRTHEKDFRESAINAIVHRKNKTGNEYRIINDFFKFLNEKYEMNISPIGPQMDTLERKMRVYNLLLDSPDISTEELCEELLVPETTIKEDIGGLRDGIHVCDQHLTLNSGKLPIFLAVNERELKNILENVNPEIAESILFQQTEFRREEILKHLEPKKSEQLRTMLENKEMSGS